MFTLKGRGIKPKTAGQRKYIDAILHHDLTFCIGPAGTGKTYLAVAAAASLLKHGQVKRIVLARPAVEAGERLGFLPGDLQAKVNPYLRPLFDALHDMMDFEQVKRFMVNDIIEVIPLAFMRGRTLNESAIILDEAQNTTASQMLMFLTRLGHDSKMIVTGDATQVDLARQRPQRADRRDGKTCWNTRNSHDRTRTFRHRPASAGPDHRRCLRTRRRRLQREPEGPGIMFGFFNQSRNCSRRSAIRENRHDYEARSASDLPTHDLVPSLAIAGVFWIAITCLLLMRKEVVQYRPGEYVPHDIVARVDFHFTDRALYDNLAKQKRESAPRVYRRIAADPWDKIQDYLLALPDTVQDRAPQELDSPLRDILDGGSITELEQDRTGAARQIYESDVKQFVAYARKHLVRR